MDCIEKMFTVMAIIGIVLVSWLVIGLLAAGINEVDTKYFKCEPTTHNLQICHKLSQEDALKILTNKIGEDK